MKKRVAIVRGPNLNSWEMQNFAPLLHSFDLVGFTTYGHNFDISTLPFEVRKLSSVGQSVRLRALRSMMFNVLGDYHDLQGLGRALTGFDIVHSAETANYFTYQAAKEKARRGFKLVVTVWENIPHAVHSPATARNKRMVNEATDLFLAVSQRTKEVLILEGAPEEKIKVQVPGIDVKHFSPGPKDPELLRHVSCTTNDEIVLFVGNLYREKGVFDLLFAFRRVFDGLGQPSTLKLLIAGKGREREAIAGLIRRLSLENNARLIGVYPYTMMPKVHNLADVFVLPSIPIPTWQEQFGYVLVESMACGKPVISTHSGSIPEIVARAGLLVPPNDFVGLADALQGLLEQEEKRREFGSLGRKRAEQSFDASRVALQTKAHYEALLGIGD